MTISTPSPQIRPGATLGIVGGGQLGRMIALAAANYGLKVHVYAPDADSPAFDVAAAHTVASYDDAAALAAFADACDVVTYEFENIPHATAAILAEHATVRPSAHALLTTQDRLVEKDFVNGLGIPTAPTAPSIRPTTWKPRSTRWVARQFSKPGGSATTARASARSARATTRRRSWRISAVRPASSKASCRSGARSPWSPPAGRTGRSPPTNPVRTSTATTSWPSPACPPRPRSGDRRGGRNIARAIAEALDYVGVLAVELFEIEGAAGPARLVVNEIAPRVHNSGTGPRKAR